MILDTKLDSWVVNSLFPPLRKFWKNRPPHPKVEYLLYEALRRVLPSKREHLFQLESGRMLLDITASCMEMKKALGIFEPETYRVLTEILRPGMTVIDAGAFIGEFTLFSAHRVGATGKVLAFEASPRNFKRLVKHIELNGLSNATPIFCALWNETGWLTLNSGPVGSADSIKTKTVHPHPETTQVETRTLDSILAERGISKIDLVKIDIEGAEEEFLQGAEQTLRNSPDVVLVLSLHPHLGINLRSIEKRLKDYGFVFCHTLTLEPMEHLKDSVTDVLVARPGRLPTRFSEKPL